MKILCPLRARWLTASQEPRDQRHQQCVLPSLWLPKNVKFFAVNRRLLGTGESCPRPHAPRRPHRHGGAVFGGYCRTLAPRRCIGRHERGSLERCSQGVPCVIVCAQALRAHRAVGACIHSTSLLLRRHSRSEHTGTCQGRQDLRWQLQMRCHALADAVQGLGGCVL